MNGATMSERTSSILIVDDEASVLGLVDTLLKRAGYETACCTSAGDALRQMQASPYGYDCLITDALMPVMSGYDLVRALRRQPDFEKLPILMLTRKRQPDDVKKAISVGVTDYILKPIDEHLLLGKVELCLKKGEGRRHLVESPVNGPNAQLKLQLDAVVVSVGETGLVLRSPVPLGPGTAFIATSRLFGDMGIAMPHLKLVRCLELENSTDMPECKYEIRLSFVGVPDVDLTKLRAWVQRETIRRRK